MDKKLLNKIVLFSFPYVLILLLIHTALLPDDIIERLVLYTSLFCVCFLFLILLIHHSIKGQTPKSNRFCFWFILISVCFLMLIFWLPSFDLKESPKKFSNSLLSSNTNIAGNLLKIEVEKVIKEIAANQNSINTWFHFKFLIVAGLFSGFFLYLKPFQKGEDKEKDLEDMARRPNLCLLLALAFILCVTMDIQIKSKTIGSKQCGLWLAHYVEKPFMEKMYNSSQCDKQFLGWENYLRIGSQGKNKPQDTGTGAGMHFDFVYGIFYWLPLYSLTYLIYIFFLIVYQNCVTRNKGIKDPILFLSFVLVNWMILSISLQGHAIPSAYEYKIWGWQFDRDQMLFIFFSIGFVLVLLNIVGTLLLIKLKKDEDEKAGHGS